MTTTDHNEKTTRTEELTADVSGRDHWMVNVATAVAGLGLSIACGMVPPLPVYKFLAGVAFIAAVVSIGMLVSRRFSKADRPTVEEADGGR